MLVIPGGQEGKAGAVTCYTCNDRESLCHINALWNIQFLLSFQHRGGIPQEVIQFPDLIPKFLRMNLGKHKNCRVHLSWFTICLVNSILFPTQARTELAERQAACKDMLTARNGVSLTPAIQHRTNRATSADQRQRLSPAQIITDSRSKVQCYQCSRVQERRPILGWNSCYRTPEKVARKCAQL